MTDLFTYWTWVVEEPDGREGVIIGMLPGTATMIPLMHRERDIAEGLRPIAEHHAAKTGSPVRLVFMRETPQDAH